MCTWNHWNHRNFFCRGWTCEYFACVLAMRHRRTKRFSSLRPDVRHAAATAVTASTGNLYKNTALCFLYLHYFITTLNENCSYKNVCIYVLFLFIYFFRFKRVQCHHISSVRSFFFTKSWLLKHVFLQAVTQLVSHLFVSCKTHDTKKRTLLLLVKNVLKARKGHFLIIAPTFYFFTNITWIHSLTVSLFPFMPISIDLSFQILYRNKTLLMFY